MKNYHSVAQNEIGSGDYEEERLVMEMGGALHRYGTPAHRIEQILEGISNKLGLEGQFFAVPTAIISAFGPLGKQRGGMVRLEPGGVDLGKLGRLDDEIKRLITGDQSPHDGLDEVLRIVADPSPYSLWMSIVASGIASGAAARFFGGGPSEIIASVIIGLVLGLLSRFFDKGPRRHVHIPLAAAFGAALAQIGQALLGVYRVDIVTISGLLYLLPGLTLTVGLTELSTRHLVSGTARLTASVLILLELGFGVAIGSKLAAFRFATGRPVPVELPEWTNIIALLLATMSYAVLFRARARDTVWIVTAGFVSFYGARLGTMLLGHQLGAFVGAFVVGVSCNLYARVLDRPPTVLLVPGILLLVPGSIGFKSVTWLLENETIKAVDAAFEMALVGMALAVGMLIANVTLSPRRAL